MRSHGRLVALVLEGSWREDPPPLGLSEAELRALAPTLLKTGAGGLAWWRVRNTPLAETPTGAELRQAFRAQALQSGLHQRRLAEAVEALQGAGIEPLLAKGWLAAGIYAQRGLRPYGDIDLWVRHEEEERAREALGYAPGQQYPVDLHPRVPAQDRSWEELVARARIERVGDARVRALGAEDHLYLLSVHMLAHGAWRPLWLCDVSAALEASRGKVDWEECLRGDPRRVNWLASAFGLARTLLGARIEDLPDVLREEAVPGWLAVSVLRAWRSGGHYMHTTPVRFTLGRPRALLESLRMRWPNPIEVTIKRGRRFDARSPLPAQLVECARRTGRFLAGKPTSVPPVG